MEKTFLERISAVQNSLKAPKSKYNSFGKYNYRNCEDILEAAKPLCAENRMVLKLSDKPVGVGDRYYIEATATLYDMDSDKTFSTTASAREALEKKGMDDSQITGTASSYARKYALNGLFDIDDTKDADSDEYRNEADAKQKKQQETKILCKQCGRPLQPVTKGGVTYSVIEAQKQMSGLCVSCYRLMQQRVKEATGETHN